MLDDLSQQVQSIYDNLSKKKEYTEASPCYCPYATPTVTILEMLPAALEIYSGPNLKEVLAMLKRGPVRCLFYFEGKCNQPSTRPAPCHYSQGMEKELEILRAKLNVISQSWTETKYPLNQALFLALEKILLLSDQNGRSPGAS